MIRRLADCPAPVLRMGREKKILLGFLGLLAGVFVGVLSMKLLVPRPPTGTGPDIRSEAAFTTPQELVEPPRPSTTGWDFTSAPALVPDPKSVEPEPPAAFGEPIRASRFVAAAPPAIDDSAVAPASWQRTSDPPTASDLSPPPRGPEPPPDASLAPTPPPNEQPARPERDPFLRQPPADAASSAPVAVPIAVAPRAAPVAGDYLVQAGDSWWSVAERAYGDGRLYRALFAWNRTRDPRVSLAPGTRLDVPPLVRLQASWPRLVPPAGW